MKRILAMLCLGVLFAAATIHAQYVTLPIPEGMGTKVEIGKEVDLGTVDRSYLNVPDIKIFRLPVYSAGHMIKSVAWHPDREHIFFSDLDYIYMVPVAGGTSRLIFDSYYLHFFEGKGYALQQPIENIIGITPDSRYLYFTRNKIGEGSGAVITIQDGGDGVSVSGGMVTLECLDLQTNELRSITQIGRNTCNVGFSGNHIAFQTGSGIRVINIGSLDSWIFPVSSGWSGIIQDTYLLYPKKLELFRIPIRGGGEQLVSASSGGLTLLQDIHCSPDGEWVLVLGPNGERHSNSGILPGGGSFSYNKTVMKLCAFNISTGQAIDALPVSKTIDPFSARFSPDGKRFCYILQNFEGIDHRQEMSIYIKNFPLGREIVYEQLAVADAAPVNFALIGNYPNPFNPSTYISFTLPSNGPVSLAVYDITGRKIRDLLSGPLSAGAHSVTWDGRDANGKAVSSGVYLSRLTQGGRTVSRRMLLMK